MRSGRGPDAPTRSAGTCPPRTSPRMSASAMLPPPTNPMLRSISMAEEYMTFASQTLRGGPGVLPCRAHSRNATVPAMYRRLAASVLLALAACDPDLADEGAGEEAEPGGVEVSEAVAFDVSPPLRELAAYDEGLPTPATIGAPGLSVNGIGQGFVGPAGTFSVSVAPADPNGDIGPNHYVQVAGTALAIFNRSGTPIYGPVPVNTLWAGFPGQCATTNDEDHQVRYDRLADRWVVTQFSVNAGN